MFSTKFTGKDFKEEVKTMEDIELLAPTSATQKLKLTGRCAQFTYTPTLPLTWRLPQVSDVGIEASINYFI